ncbi:MAG: thioredoxin domain-containing protein [Aggregatilineales bacterium]
MTTAQSSHVPLWRIVFNRYGYVSIATLVWTLLTALLMFLAVLTHTDVVFPLAISAALALAALLIWWQLSPHLRHVEPPAPSVEALLDKVRSDETPVLISLESDYCAYCMTIGKRIHQLENEENLRVIRLSVHTEPGKSLAGQFSVNTTPTYLLMDSQANLIEEWTIALPIERVRYDVRRHTATYKTVQADEGV